MESRRRATTDRLFRHWNEKQQAKSRLGELEEFLRKAADLRARNAALDDDMVKKHRQAISSAVSMKAPATDTVWEVLGPDVFSVLLGRGIQIERQPPLESDDTGAILSLEEAYGRGQQYGLDHGVVWHPDIENLQLERGK